MVAVLYCIIKGKRRIPKGKFKGFADSLEAVNPSNLPASTFWEQADYVKNSRSRGKKKRSSPKSNKSEERCREIFQQMFNAKFISVRPPWLKNPVTGKNLELDGYNSDIRTPLGKGLAFEYDGIQHSKLNKHFHRSGESEFQYQVKKDEYKDIRCKEEGVLLIRIPHYIAYGDLERFIHTKVRKKMGGTFSGTPPGVPPGTPARASFSRNVWGGKMNKPVKTSGLYGY